MNAVQKSVGSERTESKVGFSEASISTVIAAFDFLLRPWKWNSKIWHQYISCPMWNDRMIRWMVKKLSHHQLLWKWEQIFRFLKIKTISAPSEGLSTLPDIPYSLQFRVLITGSCHGTLYQTIIFSEADQARNNIRIVTGTVSFLAKVWTG